jgi:Methyltransferase domain
VHLRVVEPELLDQLPPDDPRVVQCRRDLKRANTLMMHPFIMARLLYRYWEGAPPRTLVDLGAGDGTFMLRVAQRLARYWRDVHVILLDRGAIVSDGTRAGYAALNWSVEPVRAHVQDFAQLRGESVDIVTANLFLHQLKDDDLANLLAQAAPMARLFAACELQRTRLVREIGRMQWLIGAGELMCHDGVISTRASFWGGEISALWPRQDGWTLVEKSCGPLTHVFVAKRQAR